jgi:hypothetical protein
MRTLKRVSLIWCLLIVISCKKEAEQPKVSYDKTNKHLPKEQPKSASIITVADLPIHFTGSDYLIFPIGQVTVSDNDSKFESSSAEVSHVSFSVSDHIDNEITGNLKQIKIQKINSDSLVALTSKNIIIESITFLKDIKLKNKSHILVYEVADNDTNKDGIINVHDIKSLYLSEDSGTRFTKITNDFEELLDWNLVEVKNRIYLRTVEDTNKNGAMDAKDQLRNGYINLLDNEWKATEYKPF